MQVQLLGGSTETSVMCVAVGATSQGDLSLHMVSPSQGGSRGPLQP